MIIRLLIVGSITLIVGFLVGYYSSTPNASKSSVASSSCSNSFKYLNEQLDCDSKQVISKNLYTQFSFKLQEYILEKQKNGEVSHVSVYFRDLVQGPTFGIEEDVDFAPASLLKLPMLITYLSLSETDKSILQKKTKFIGVRNTASPQIKPEEEIEINKLYTVQELLQRMIIHSDNLAYGLLDKFLTRLYPDEKIYIKTMQELGLINPEDPTESTFTVRTYSSLFRQLYNGSYLSFENSDKALDLLAQTKYNKGLPEGIPQNIQVAHKFGEREILEVNEKQFHDCGIIYYPGNPYLLCVMTRGRDMEALVKTISEISELVYKEIDSRKL